MKNILIAIGLTFLINAAAQAQVSVIPKVGITGAAQSRPTFTNDQGLELSHKGVSGFTAGVGLNFPVAGVFSFQPELLYIQKGFQQELTDGTNTATNDVKLNYLEVPLLARVMVGNKVKFIANVGPSIGYALSGSYKTIDGQDTEEGDVEFDDDTNRLDIGFQAGPGVLQLEGRLGYGLNNFLKTPDPIPADEDEDYYKSRNVVFSISIGYAIPLGR